jgi:RNA polymerase sigma-70 factor (ECF subfamily)
MKRVATTGAASQSETGLDFETFFQAEHPKLYRALYLLTDSAAEADDLAQEAMARVYERWDRVQAMDSPVGYLYRTALNLNRKRLRRLLRWPRPDVMARPEDPALTVERRQQILGALAGLAAPQREALVLVEWLGMSQVEAARALGIKPVSLRVRLSRGRADLHRRLEVEDE